MRESLRDKMKRHIENDRKFMEERGNSLSGYIAFYEKYGRSAEDAAAIYRADLEYHNKLVAKWG